MEPGFVQLEEASSKSGLHPNTLRRLLRLGTIFGYKTSRTEHVRWMVSIRSLAAYTDPVYGIALDHPGPKVFLKKQPSQAIETAGG